jgi:3-oxoacyl-[acyl-carrier-protein] synthase II
MPDRKVVITGLGAVTSLGLDVPSFWEGLGAGTSGTSRVTLFDVSGYASQIGSEVKDFEPTRYFPGVEARRLDRFSQFGLVAADEAVRDAKLELGRLNPGRAGALIGSGIGGLAEIEAQHTVLLERGPRRVSPLMIPKLMLNAASAQISIKYGLGGPNIATATACASAGHAIAEAFKLIQEGKAEVMLAGGSEAALTPLGLAGFCALKALSTRNDDPEHASRPFDKDRDGFVLGEGAGIVVLEELEHAREREAPIYCELAGCGMSADAHHITAPDPEGKGAILCMRQALQDADVAPGEIDYINAHGTSTVLNDIAETQAMKAVFGEHAYKLAISSTKSMIGHLLGASGGAELVATILALKEGVIHPTINLDEPDPQCDLDYVPKQARRQSVEWAMSNSFGFGGHNVSLVVRRFR